MKKLILFVLIFPIFLFAKVQVTTYFPLETYFIKKISKEDIDVVQVTHRYTTNYFELPTSGVDKLSSSKIFFHFGLDIETKYEKIFKQNNHSLKVVDLSKTSTKIGLNPYVWTDPFNAKEIAKLILDSLIQIDERNKGRYQKNYEEFLLEIDQLFLTILQTFNKSQINGFYAIENHWDYFANRFRLEVFKKDKKLFSTAELKELSENYKTIDVNKFLYYSAKDQNFVDILSKTLNSKTIQNDIFTEDWETNLINLTNDLTK